MCSLQNNTMNFPSRFIISGYELEQTHLLFITSDCSDRLCSNIAKYLDSPPHVRKQNITSNLQASLGPSQVTLPPPHRTRSLLWASDSCLSNTLCIRPEPSQMSCHEAASLRCQGFIFIYSQCFVSIPSLHLHHDSEVYVLL